MPRCFLLTVFSNENKLVWVEIAIEIDLKCSASQTGKRMVALRSRLITELNHLFIILNDMNSDDKIDQHFKNSTLASDPLPP